MDDRVPTTARRRLLWLLLALVTIALAVGAASCGGDDEEAAAPPPAEPAEPPAEPAEPPAEPAEPPAEPAEPPAEPPAEAECPAEDGVINVFAAADTPSAALGQNISPAAFTRMSGLWIDKTNSEGGILGCQVEFTVEDDTFDIPTCVRLYRDAVASGKYDFFIGPTNSGCMASLPPIVNGGGYWLFSGIAADHQPFFNVGTFEEAPYVAHSSVSTILEGRANAVWALEQGCQTAASMVPNYAYGQDVGVGFKDYFEANGGKVVNEQFPEFDEDQFTPFINAMVAAKPDCMISAFFSAFIVPFMKQWEASGNDADIPLVAGLGSYDTWAAIQPTDTIPDNFWAYDRGNWQLLQANPVAAEYIELWDQTYGAEYPIPDSFTFQLLSTWQMAKALIEQTGSLDREAWKSLIETGEFGFESPYNSGTTYVNPVSHMADTCASVGRVIADTSVPGYNARLDPDTWVLGCMHEVFTPEEVRELTTNPDVTDEALAKYYELATGGS